MTDPAVPATRQIVDLLGYGSPRWLANGLSLALAGFALAAIVRSFKLLAALRPLDVAQLGSLSARGPYLFLATLLLLCPLLVRANQNTRAFGETPENSSIRLVGICLVPITNLVLPYFAVKDIWQNTRGGSVTPPRWLPLWWWALLLQALAPAALLKAAHGEANMLLSTTAAILAGPGSVVAFALTAVVVRNLASEQTARYERLPQAIAPSTS